MIHDSGLIFACRAGLPEWSKGSLSQSRSDTMTNVLTYYDTDIITAGYTKEGSITVPLTSCSTGLESAV